MTASRKIRFTILCLVLAITVGCDQTTKHLARAELSQRGSINLPGGFGELRLAENPGSFLSLGAALPSSLRHVVFTVGVGLGLLGLWMWLGLRARLGWLSFLGLSLAMAGGASNLIDRITRDGLVTDFLFLQVGPLHTGVFNMADVVILCGLAMIAGELWKQRNQTKSGRPV